MSTWGKTPNGLQTSYVRCKNPKYVDPNFYERNKYAARDTTILYNKAHHITINRRAQATKENMEKYPNKLLPGYQPTPLYSELYYGTAPNRLTETIPCSRMVSTSDPNFISDNKYPSRKTKISKAEENLYCHGRLRNDSYGICYRPGCVPGVFDEKTEEIKKKIKKIEEDLEREKQRLKDHDQRAPPVTPNCQWNKDLEAWRTGSNRTVNNYHT